MWGSTSPAVHENAGLLLAYQEKLYRLVEIYPKLVESRWCMNVRRTSGQYARRLPEAFSGLIGSIIFHDSVVYVGILKARDQCMLFTRIQFEVLQVH